MEGPPPLPREQVHSWMDDVHSNASATIPPPPPSGVNTAEMMAFNQSAPIWVTQRHEEDWNATVGSDQAVIEDCCKNGAALLSQLNPEAYQMPFGSRVVCIKTTHLVNIHQAMSSGIWTVQETVGKKINTLFDENDAAAGEKVLFIFSINKQRSFCALAEMTGPWKFAESRAGWQEQGGNFSVAGKIPIIFTHVKNVANDHFEHLQTGNRNQKVTNMWNGMHFEPDNGRDVVKIYHQQAHFTNVLCRDKRKSYSPWDEVMNGQDLDPRITRKYKVPPPMGHLQPRRVHKPMAVANWRQVDADKKEDTTPTRPQLEKKSDSKPQASFKTPTPTHQRTMKRDHAPTPLQLRTGAGQSLPSPSPRPGQIIKCIVDENGNFVPITPFGDSAGAHSPIPDVISAQNPAPFDQMHESGQEETALLDRPYANTHSEKGKDWKLSGTRDTTTGNGQNDCAGQPPKTSLPRLSRDFNEGAFAPSHRALRHAKTSENLARDGKEPQIYVAPNSEWSRNIDYPSEFLNLTQEQTLPDFSSGLPSFPYSMEFPELPEWYTRSRPTDVPGKCPLPSDFCGGPSLDDMQGGQHNGAFRMPPSVHTAPDTDDMWAVPNPTFPHAQAQGHAYTLVDSASNTNAQPAARVNDAKMTPQQLISRYAQERNEGVIRYDAHRLREMRNNADISAASTLHPEYLDWASTSEVERSRIRPFSPTSAGHPFTGQSVSKFGTPTSKAFAASVNREIRTMRQGQRPSPTPKRIGSNAPSLHNEEGPSTALCPCDSSSSGHATAASTDKINGGVRVSQTVDQANVDGMNENGFSTFTPLFTQGNSAPLTGLIPGLGQVPRNLFPAFVAAGHTASTPSNNNGSARSQPALQANMQGYRQQDVVTTDSPARKAYNDAESTDDQPRDGSDLIRFNS